MARRSAVISPNAEFLRAAQVAERLSVSESQVRRWMQEGLLDTFYLSPRVVRIPVASYERFKASVRAAS